MENDLETQETRAVVPAVRGDSFDLSGGSQVATQDPQIINILQNPNALAQLLDINEEQAANIRAAIVGGGAGISAKFLSKYFGSSVAGAFGAFAAGLIADRMFKKK